MTSITAHQDEPLEEPAEAMVEAARLLTKGAPYKAVAAACGVTERTLRNWRSHYLWPSALAAAEAEVRRELLGKALQSALTLVEAGDEQTTRFVLDLFLVRTQRGPNGRPAKAKAADNTPNDPLEGASTAELRRLSGLDDE